MRKNFFLHPQEEVLLAADCGSLELESGNRKNFFAAARQKRKNSSAVGCLNCKNVFAVLCGNTLKGTRQGTRK